MNTTLPPALQPALSLAMHADEQVLWAGKGEVPGARFLHYLCLLCGGLGLVSAALFAIGILYGNLFPLTYNADFLTLTAAAACLLAGLYMLLGSIKSYSHYVLTDAAAYILTPPLPFTSTARAKRFPLCADLICSATISADGRGSLFFTRPAVYPLPHSPYAQRIAPEGFFHIPDVAYVKQLIEEYTVK